jgi:cell wall-associated NlpC family hydrolase
VSAVPAWCEKWIGLPFRDKGRGPDGYDCWGYVRAIMLERFGVTLPDYADAYTDPHDHASVATAVEAGLRDGWKSVSAPCCGDLVVIKIAGRPWHCALAVSPDRFLHCPSQQERHTGREIGMSCIERFDNVIWTRRIEGIYRYAGDGGSIGTP